jgi:hypothetical protein
MLGLHEEMRSPGKIQGSAEVVMTQCAVCLALGWR